MKQTAIVVIGLLALTLGAASALAYPSFFDSRCSSCHSNDTQTCNGCHHHGPVNLSAVADAISYSPGATVTVTLDGGSQHGWIRGILYDESDLVVALATGPTGMGDDSAGGAVTFPVDLQASAPGANGTYAWEAAWFGGDTDGNGHGEVRTPVSVVVEGTPVADGSWSTIKSLY